MFSPYDSLEFLIFRDKSSCHCPLGEGDPMNEGEKVTPLKRRYSTGIGSSDVKMVADKHRRAAYRRNVNSDDLE